VSAIVPALVPANACATAPSAVPATAHVQGYLKAVRLDPSSAPLWEGLGAAYQTLGRHTAALKVKGISGTGNVSGPVFGDVSVCFPIPARLVADSRWVWVI
jgi:hypothetical protein